MKKILVVLAAMSMLAASPALAEFKKCVGPDGDVRIVNTECPDGYTVEGSMPASKPSSSGDSEEPYICRFADIIEAVEIDSALAEAEAGLIAAREKADLEAQRYWTECQKNLKRRQVKLQTPLEEPEAGPAACTEGEFEYREGGIFFTNSRRSSCQGVRAVCTFDIRKTQRLVGDSRDRQVDRRRDDEYATVNTQEVQNFSYDGKVGKFGTERIGDTDVKGKVTGVHCQIIN